MNQKYIWGLLVILALAAGVYSSIARNATPSEQPLKVGLILPLTGPAAGVGEVLKRGYEWKAEELRETGFGVRFVIEDTGSETAKAISAFKKLTSLDHVHIIFTVVSPTSLALKPLAEESRVLLWADAAHPDLTKDSHYVLRHSSLTSSNAARIVEFAQKHQMQKIGMLYQHDDWGQAVRDGVTQLLASSTALRVDFEPVNATDTDLRTQLQKILRGKPDGLVFSTFGPAAGALVKESRELGFKGPIYSSLGFALTPKAQEIAGAAAQGMEYELIKPNDNFVEAYRARYGEAPAMTSFIAYTDLELLAHTIQTVKSAKPDDILRYIKSLGTFVGKYETVKIDPSGDILLDTAVQVWK